MDDPGIFSPTQPAFDPSAYSSQLDFYKKYDPNASVTGTWTAPPPSGGDDPHQGTGYYIPQFNYDQSKVPKIGGDVFSDADRQYLLPMDELGTGRNLANYKLYDPKLVYNDPVYGRVTDVRNLDQRGGFDWIGTLGPMAVGGAMGLAGAGLAGSLAMGGFNAVKGLAEGQSWQRVLANAGLGAAGAAAGGLVSGAVGGGLAGGIAGGVTSGAIKNLGGQLIDPYMPQTGPSDAAINFSGINRDPFSATGGNMPLNPTYPNGYPQPDFTMDPITVTGSREPDYPEGFPPGYTPSDGGGSSPFNVGSIVDPFTGGGGGGGSDFYNRAALFGSAINDWYSSNQYMDMATKYAHLMNPFDTQRDYYQGLLRKSYEDPTAVLNDPAHKAIQERQMAALSAKLGASGYMGSGLEKTQLADYLATSDNQFMNDYRNGLITPSGANIGPAAAAGLIQTGIKGSIDARNNALANAARAFNPATGPSTVINNNNSSGSQNPASGAGKPMDLSYLKKIYPDAVVSGVDKYGNKVLTAGGKMIGYLTDDGKSFTPYTPGQSGETDTSGDSGSGYGGGGPAPLDPSDPEFNQWAGNSWTSGYDLPGGDPGFDITDLGLFDP